MELTLRTSKIPFGAYLPRCNFAELARTPLRSRDIRICSIVNFPRKESRVRLRTWICLPFPERFNLYRTDTSSFDLLFAGRVNSADVIQRARFIVKICRFYETQEIIEDYGTRNCHAG